MEGLAILLRGGTVLYHLDDDHVTCLEDTDVLIEGNIIKKVGKGLKIDDGVRVEVIECQGKIVSPGFVNTHHHLWQTQLKGRHADHNLLEYFPSGNMASYSFSPEDIYWGQLAGCLEAVDAGTTFVLDHAHGCYTAEHASRALDATTASGLRSIYAYAIPILISKWDKNECVPNLEALPDWALDQIEEWARTQPFGDGRVQVGFAFDSFFLPKDVVVGLFERFQRAGVKVITSHVTRNAVLGTSSTLTLLKEYNLLSGYIVASHATGLDAAEKKILRDSGIYVSSTPDTEAQMGMGFPVALDPDIVYGSLGADCHTNNSASILSRARTLLLLARQQRNAELLDQGKYPATLRASTQRVFNLATIDGARAVGMGDVIGSIREGKLADLVVFDAGPANSPGMLCASEFDPVTAVVRHSDVRDIEVVIVDGKVRKREGRLVGVDGKHGNTNKTKRTMEWSEIAREVVKSQREVQNRIDALDVKKGEELLVKMLHIDLSKFERSD